MPNILKSAVLAVLLCAPAGTALAASAAFDFTFRTGGTDTIVGTGSMSFDDPGDGNGNLIDLQNVTASFVFGEDSLDWDAWTNDPSQDNTYEISTNQGIRSLLISASFVQGPTNLRSSLEMNFGLGFSFMVNDFSAELVTLDGDYLATAGSEHTPSVIPLPATLPLLVAGLGGLMLLRRRVGAD